MTKCGQNCTACPYGMTKNRVKVNDREEWKIKSEVTCSTINCVFMLHCDKCGKIYIGETGRILRARLSDHRGYINNQVITATTGDHINLVGHSLANHKVIILEKVEKNDEMYIKQREKYFINKLSTFYECINKEV